MQLATVKIKSDNPLGYAIINERDFDGSKHTLWGSDAAPSQTAVMAAPASAFDPVDTVINAPDETWDKPSLESYAKERFGASLDRRKSVRTMLSEIRTLEAGE